MKETKEIAALIQLIDDPDETIYSSVEKKLRSYGNAIIPNLETAWESTDNPLIQERIEMLIHSVQTAQIKNDLFQWAAKSEPDLLEGACILNHYHFPENDLSIIHQQIEKLRRSIWLELSPHLTALEQTNVLTGYLFQYCHFKQTEMNYERPGDFLVSVLLEQKKGNALSLTILQLILAELNDIPLRLIQIPGQLMMGYITKHIGVDGSPVKDDIPFYVDGGTGQIFSYEDIDSYLKKIGAEWSEHFFVPLTTKEIISLLIEDYARCFQSDEQLYKYRELIALAETLKG
jgi:hypothetical protein